MAEAIRRALRSYHCYACEREFREMVDLNDPSSVRCPNCESDFLEEKKSFEQDQQAQARPQAQPQPQPRPQMQPQMQQSASVPQAGHVPQMHHRVHGQPGTQQFVQMRQGGPHHQQQTVTRTYSPNGGWTQSVTVSFGTGGAQPQVHQNHAFQSAQQQQRAPNEFASAAHANQMPHQQMPHQQMPHQQMPHQHPREVPHPFAQMEQMFGGNFMGPMGPHPRQPQQQQPGNPADIFAQMFGGMRGFFQAGFPEGFQFGDADRPRSRGCSEEFITNLPDKEAGKESDCYICLEKCKEGKLSCALPCGHAFDRDCIKNWLNEHDSCPVCRKKLENNRPQAAEPQPNQNQNNMAFFF